MDGINVLIGWNDERRFVDNVFFRRSVDAGASFQTLTRLTGSPFDDSAPVFGLSGSNAVLGWLDNRDGDINISFRRSDNSGMTWSAAGRIVRAPTDDPDVHCALMGSNVACAWTDLRTGASRLRARFSIDGGQTWPIIMNLE